MAPFRSLLAAAIFGCAQIVSSQDISLSSQDVSPTPTPTLGQNTTTAANIPAFTFRAIDSYFVKDDPKSQPQKDKLEMLPRGYYDDFPEDGVTIAFGPDLKQQMKDAMGGEDCKKNPTECRKKLTSVIQNRSSDIDAHSKRFILVSAFLVGAIVAVTVELLIAAAIAGTVYLAAENIPSVKYEYSDMDQIHNIGNADKFTVEQEASTGDATTITVQPTPKPATPTSNDKITIETLTADNGERKAGDIVYHIPPDSVRQINDVLAMMDIQSLVDKCKGLNLLNTRNIRARQPNVLEACQREIPNRVADFMETVPEAAVQLAEQFIPQAPGAGQAIAFPVPNAVVDGRNILVVPYRLIRVRVRPGGRRPAGGPAPPAPGAQLPGFSMRTFLRSDLGYTILAAASFAGGKIVEQLWMPKSSFSYNTKEDEFACPQDILCIEEDCGAQADDQQILARNTFCKKPKHQGCKCARVNYLDHTEVPSGYIQDQYKWLEELIGLADDLARPSLSIGMRTVVSPHGASANVENTWRFFSTKIGHAVGCDQTSELVSEITPQGPSSVNLSGDVDPKSLPWPGGEFKVKIADQDCVYKNNGNNPGRLFCPNKEISCVEDPAKNKGSQKCSSTVSWQPVVYCDF